MHRRRTARIFFRLDVGQDLATSGGLQWKLCEEALTGEWLLGRYKDAEKGSVKSVDQQESQLSICCQYKINNLHACEHNV